MEYLKFFSMLGMGIYGIYDSCRFAKNNNLFPGLRKEALEASFNKCKGSLTASFNKLSGKFSKK